MRIALITLLLVSIAVSAFAFTFCRKDPKCYYDCIDQGYSFGYCKQLCTYCEETGL